MLLEAGSITALKCAWTLAHREEKREDDAGEDFFDRGSSDSGNKMEEGEGKVGTQSSRGRSGGTKESAALFARPNRSRRHNLLYVRWPPMAKKKRSGVEDRRAGCWFLPIN